MKEEIIPVVKGKFNWEGTPNWFEGPPTPFFELLTGERFTYISFLGSTEHELNQRIVEYLEDTPHHIVVYRKLPYCIPEKLLWRARLVAVK